MNGVSRDPDLCAVKIGGFAARAGLAGQCEDLPIARVEDDCTGGRLCKISLRQRRQAACCTAIAFIPGCARETLHVDLGQAEGFLLEFLIERGDDVQTAAFKTLAIEMAGQLGHDEVDEGGAVLPGASPAGRGAQGRGHILDHVQCLHDEQHFVTMLRCGLRRVDGVDAGRLADGREQGRLGEAEFGGRLVKVEFGGRIDPKGVLSVSWRS